MTTKKVYCLYSPRTKVYEFRCEHHMHNWMWDVSDKYLSVLLISHVTNEFCVVCTGERTY